MNFQHTGDWCDRPEIVVAGFRCRTDFAGFLEALRAGQTLILCRWQSPPFYSRDRSGFSRGRRTAAERFFAQKIAWIPPTEPETGDEETRGEECQHVER